MDENRIRVMAGALVGSLNQRVVEVHRANTRLSLATRHQRGVNTAHSTVEALNLVAIPWTGAASGVHDGDDGAVDIIRDASLITVRPSGVGWRSAEDYAIQCQPALFKARASSSWR